MVRINADANIIAVNAAKKAGVPKFIYISVHDYNLPEFALNNGYFQGKRKAEAEILSAFPNTGVLHQSPFLFFPADIERACLNAIFLHPVFQRLKPHRTFCRPGIPLMCDEIPLLKKLFLRAF